MLAWLPTNNSIHDKACQHNCVDELFKPGCRDSWAAQQELGRPERLAKLRRQRWATHRLHVQIVLLCADQAPTSMSFHEREPL